jgi:hypothetical protein
LNALDSPALRYTFATLSKRCRMHQIIQSKRQDARLRLTLFYASLRRGARSIQSPSKLSLFEFAANAPVAACLQVLNR